MKIKFVNNYPYETEPDMVRGPYDSLRVMLEFLIDPNGNTIAAWNDEKLRWSVYTKGKVHYFTDYVITNDD